MDEITRVGIDLAKKLLHVTALDATGAVVDRKRLRRAGSSRIWRSCRGAASWPWRHVGAHTTGGGWQCGWATGRCWRAGWRSTPGMSRRPRDGEERATGFGFDIAAALP